MNIPPHYSIREISKLPPDQIEKVIDNAKKAYVKAMRENAVTVSFKIANRRLIGKVIRVVESRYLVQGEDGRKYWLPLSRLTPVDHEDFEILK